MTKIKDADTEIDAILAADAEVARRKAELSIPVLNDLLEAEVAARTALAEMTRLADRVLMPEAVAGFQPLRLYLQRSGTVLDVTRKTAERMIERATAVAAPTEG